MASKNNLFLLTPLREGRPLPPSSGRTQPRISTHAPAGGATVTGLADPDQDLGFLLTPLREGRPEDALDAAHKAIISTHAPAGGATGYCCILSSNSSISTHAPAGGATDSPRGRAAGGRISTHAPAGGATLPSSNSIEERSVFLLTPLREGRQKAARRRCNGCVNFYSRPCGRGDPCRTGL